MKKACLVSTIRNAQAVLGTFIAHHLGIGFSHLYLFVDDPGELPAYAPYESDQVHLIPFDNDLLHCWLRTPSAATFFPYVNREVMARQCLNAEVAISLAREDGCDWIFHLDADELLLLPGGCASVPRYLASQDDYDIIQFYNHEAIPETLYVDDYFREVNLFKQNFFLLDEAAKACVRSLPGGSRSYFRSYANGKGAGNLARDLRCYSVNSFEGADKLRTLKGSFRQHAGDPSAVSDRILVERECAVLHYACCGLNHFIRKYETLGAFGDKWYDKIDIRERQPSHLLSRDAVLAGPAAAERFYREVYLDQLRDHLPELEERGIVFRRTLFPEAVQAVPCAG